MWFDLRNFFDAQFNKTLLASVGAYECFFWTVAVPDYLGTKFISLPHIFMHQLMSGKFALWFMLYHLRRTLKPS